jgi:hypothetical protein
MDVRIVTYDHDRTELFDRPLQVIKETTRDIFILLMVRCAAHIYSELA